MKIFFFSLFLVSLCFAIDFDDKAKISIQKAYKKHNALKSKVDVSRINIRKLKHEKTNFDFLKRRFQKIYGGKEKTSINGQKKFGRVNVDENRKSIVFQGFPATKIGVPIHDFVQEDYRKIAFEKLKNNFYLNYLDDEEIILQNVQKDVRTKRNKQSKDISIVRSVKFHFARKAYDQPIFNSNIILELDAVTKEIIFLIANNWIDIDVPSVNNLNNFDTLYVKEKISDNIINRDVNDNYLVTDFVSGWLIGVDGKLEFSVAIGAQNKNESKLKSQGKVAARYVDAIKF